MILEPGDAIPGYRFTVVIFTAAVPNPIDIAFQEVSGLKISRNVLQRERMTTLDGKRSLQTLTLKRGVFSRLSPLTVANSLESLFWDTRLLRKELLINTLNEKGFPANAWLINNAFLESWEWESLNAESNKILIESMSFKYSDIKYRPLSIT